MTQPLQDGDQFSLLPKELIFKVDKTKTATPSSLGKLHVVAMVTIY